MQITYCKKKINGIFFFCSKQFVDVFLHMIFYHSTWPETVNLMNTFNIESILLTKLEISINKINIRNVNVSWKKAKSKMSYWNVQNEVNYLLPNSKNGNGFESDLIVELNINNNYWRWQRFSKTRQPMTKYLLLFQLVDNFVAFKSWKCDM